PAAESQLVVDGTITDEPGPYVITLSRTRALGTSNYATLPESDAKISIQSDAGETDNLVAVSGQPGAYATTSIQGLVGRSYSITIKLANGSTYVSDTEKMLPAGTINSIEYEFEPRIQPGGIAAGIFRIYSTGRAGSDGVNYFRWRTFGTYKVRNFPEERTMVVGEAVVPDPEPCSGYINRNNRLVYVGPPCTCCICWVSEYGIPTVTDTRLVTGGALNKVRVGTVTVNRRTFYDKYYVEVQMLSLTQDAYNFWKLIESQREGASSLFQPPLAQVKSNIHSESRPDEVIQGYFGASSIRRKSIFLSQKDVPLLLLPTDTVKSSCIGTNSSTSQPPFWK
ncbi:MAG TPA: DUF4249 domain-containing protein, partial [Cyclobacteriaceae bacterium]|nr:DUF4249 domain-containing protein [Cyclobacteriaceae bacterium]